MTCFIDTLDISRFTPIAAPEWDALGKSIHIYSYQNSNDSIYVYWMPAEQRTVLMVNYLYYSMPNTDFNLCDIFAALNAPADRLYINNIQQTSFHNLIDTHIKDIDWQYTITIYPPGEEVPPTPEPSAPLPPAVRNPQRAMAGTGAYEAAVALGLPLSDLPYWARPASEHNDTSIALPLLPSAFHY